MTERILLNRVTIKDCDVETFKAGGPGGQNQNKRDTGVRIRHRESGAVGESREERSQLQNKRKAFVRMAESERFQQWNRRKAFNFDEKVRKTVEDQMRPENLLIEYFDPQG